MAQTIQRLMELGWFPAKMRLAIQRRRSEAPDTAIEVNMFNSNFVVRLSLSALVGFSYIVPANAEDDQTTTSQTLQNRY